MFLLIIWINLILGYIKGLSAYYIYIIYVSIYIIYKINYIINIYVCVYIFLTLVTTDWNPFIFSPHPLPKEYQM